MLKKDSGNDPQEILTQAIEQMKVEQAEKFDPKNEIRNSTTIETGGI